MNKLLKKMIIFILKLKYKIINKSYIGRDTHLNLKTIIEGKNKIGINNKISSSSIGYGTYIGENNKLDKISIGKYCSIGSNIDVITGTHPTKTFVSTHPAFFSLNKQAGFTYVEEQLFYEETKVDDKFNIVIQNDVWIGNNVSIMGGVTINNGAIVGANSLVKEECEPYGIYAGIPARKIGQRFSDDQINILLKLQWWENDVDWIIKNIHNFNDINTFIERVKHV